MARRIARELRDAASLEVAHALARPSGLFAALADQPRAAARGRRPEEAFGLRSHAPLALASLVDPLLAWALSDESAIERGTALATSGLRHDVLYANVVEACARALGDRVRTGRLSEAELTLGVVRLQTLVRAIASSRTDVPFVPRRVLLATAPDEPHGLGMAIAAACFGGAGWDAVESAGVTRADIGGLAGGQSFDVVVFCLSSARRRMARLDALARAVDAARRAAQERVVLLVSGRAFAERAASARDVGADGACASAADAPAMAARLLRN